MQRSLNGATFAETKPDISTVDALLKVTVNFEMSCREMHLEKLTNHNEVGIDENLFQWQIHKANLFN